MTIYLYKKEVYCMQKRLDEYVKNNNMLSNRSEKTDLKKDTYNRITNSEQFYSRFRHCI